MFVACLAPVLAGIAVVAATAAELEGTIQELRAVTASGEALAARWMRQPDSYTLQVRLDPTRHAAKVKSVMAADQARRAASREQRAANGENLTPSPEQRAPVSRGSAFIGQTIANLRGMDPQFCDRILTLVDGRIEGRSASAPRDNGHRVGVTLLRADGSEIPRSGYSCVADSAAIDVQFRYSLEDGVQAGAATVRIDDVYYNEKLEPLAQQPVPADIP